MVIYLELREQNDNSLMDNWQQQLLKNVLSNMIFLAERDNEIDNRDRLFGNSVSFLTTFIGRPELQIAEKSVSGRKGHGQLLQIETHKFWST